MYLAPGEAGPWVMPFRVQDRMNIVDLKPDHDRSNKCIFRSHTYIPALD